jgi:glycosyltransferase involved in cell wall biosynthesis
VKVLIDLHHTDLYRSFQLLFERRFGWEVYRPEGRDWADRGYFHHPRDDERYGLLTRQSEFDPAKHKTVFDASEGGVLWKDKDQDGILFRWLTLDRIKEVDLIVCSVYRNEDQFYRLRRDFGLKCPIIRYAGNGGEQVDPSKFDIFIPAHLPLYEQYVATGQKPGLLYHPEFEIDNGMYCWTPLPDADQQQIARIFLNFIYHHRGPGTPYEQWMRYCGYCDEIHALHLMHGLGTPPPGVEVDLDVIIDTSFRKMGLDALLDRKTWPDLRVNRGEPPNHRTLSNLMKFSNIVVHPKPSPPEGYGFIIHQVAACGRPLVVPQWYRQLSASRFLQDRETCIYITGDDPLDKANFKWAMQPENNARMAAQIRRRFDENVNFSAEADKIKSLL